MGETFRLAREKQGIDIGEAADKLRMSRRQLVALEADDLASLPSPTFIRGFIRNYARLLQLSPEPLLEAYLVVAPDSAGNVTITLPSEEIPILAGDRKAWLPYLIASLVLGIAGGAWWAYMDWHERTPEKKEVAVNEASAPTATPMPVMPPEQSKPAEMPATIEQPLPASPAVAVAPPVVALQPTPVAPSQPATPAAATTPLVMKFTQPSWIRVTDRDGKEILQKSKPAGSEETIAGTPPFKLEIGNASGVQLSYKGQPVDLAPHAKLNVARLTLE